HLELDANLSEGFEARPGHCRHKEDDGRAPILTVAKAGSDHANAWRSESRPCLNHKSGAVRVVAGSQRGFVSEAEREATRECRCPGKKDKDEYEPTRALAGLSDSGLPPILSCGRLVGASGARAVDRHVQHGHRSAQPLRSASLAYPRNAVRLRHGGYCGLPAHRDSELDLAASDQRSSPGAAGRLVATWPHRLLDFGACSAMAGDHSRFVLSGRSDWSCRVRNCCRPELAQLADGRAGDRSLHRQSADAPRGQWRSLARRAWLASRTRRRDRADLGGRRPDRAELHPELAD